MKIVVARPLDSLTPDNSLTSPDWESPSIGSLEHYQKLASSLRAKLEFQSAEVDHWKHECERYYTIVISSEQLVVYGVII